MINMILIICLIFKDFHTFMHTCVHMSVYTCMAMQTHVSADNAQEARISHQVPPLVFSI